jgi:hypothetical protein
VLMYRPESVSIHWMRATNKLERQRTGGDEKSAGLCNPERIRITAPMEQPSTNGLRFPIFFSNIYLLVFIWAYA